MATSIDFYGLRRSGNHIVLDWIMSHWDRAVLANNLPVPVKRLIRPSSTVWQNCDCVEDAELVVRSFEDKPVPNRDPPRGKYDPPPETTTFVIVRSFYNMIASRMNRTTEKLLWSSCWRRGMEMWPDYANRANIVFDRWVQDEAYRYAIEVANGWDHQPVPEKLHRSSFGDRNVLERWKGWDFPPEVLENEECRELNMRIFGWALDATGSLIRA